jgi:transposase
VTLYSEDFRNRMVEKLTRPHAIAATALCAEVGVPQSTLSRWSRGAGTVSRTMPPSDDDTKAAPPTKRPQDWTAEERLALVNEAAAIRGGAPQAHRGSHELGFPGTSRRSSSCRGSPIAASTSRPSRRSIAPCTTRTCSTTPRARPPLSRPHAHTASAVAGRIVGYLPSLVHGQFFSGPPPSPRALDWRHAQVGPSAHCHHQPRRIVGQLIQSLLELLATTTLIPTGAP